MRTTYITVKRLSDKDYTVVQRTFPAHYNSEKGLRVEDRTISSIYQSRLEAETVANQRARLAKMSYVPLGVDITTFTKWNNEIALFVIFSSGKIQQIRKEDISDNGPNISRVMRGVSFIAQNCPAKILLPRCKL